MGSGSSAPTVSTLDLSGRPLRRISSNFPTDALETVRLSRTGLKDPLLPPSAPLLKSLWLDHNGMEAITPQFCQMLKKYPNLRLLVLSGNRFERLPSGFTGYPVVELDLSDNNIPAFRGEWPDLETLHLSRNRIADDGPLNKMTSIKKDLFQYTALHVYMIEFILV
jgi:Leucine-rich repeat (LRR) protein